MMMEMNPPASRRPMATPPSRIWIPFVMTTTSLGTEDLSMSQWEDHVPHSAFTALRRAAFLRRAVTLCLVALRRLWAAAGEGCKVFGSGQERDQLQQPCAA